MTLKLTTTARKLKVTMMIDAAPFAALRAIPDSAPSRTELMVAVAGRTVTADLATKSVRKAVKTLTENGGGQGRSHHSRRSQLRQPHRGSRHHRPGQSSRRAATRLRMTQLSIWRRTAAAKPAGRPVSARADWRGVF